MGLKRAAVWVVVTAFLVTVVGLGIQGTWAQEEAPLAATVGSGDPTLLAKGVAVSVPVLYTCTAASGVTVDQAHLFVQVRQANPKKQINFGDAFRSFDPICDGQQHTIDVTVFSFGEAFRKGVALVTTNLDIHGTDPTSGEYGGNVFVNAFTSTEVRVR